MADYISAHVETIMTLSSLGEPQKAASVVNDIPSGDYHSRYLAWDSIKRGAVLVDDIYLARRAGSEADYCFKQMR